MGMTPRRQQAAASHLAFGQAAAAFLILLLLPSAPSVAQSAPPIAPVEIQPLAAQVKRLAKALDNLGAPLNSNQKQRLEVAFTGITADEAIAHIEKVLDPLCLATIEINPESRVKATAGPAARELVEQGWRVFLVKVHNEAGVTSVLRCTSPNAASIHQAWVNDPTPKQTITPAEVRDRWMDVQLYDSPPMNERLSGLPLEYRIIEIYSRDLGQREAALMFDIGGSTKELGNRNELNLLFDCKASTAVKLDILDEDGQPTTAQLTFHDVQGRVYPARSRRLAPDFFFQDQVYRANGETVRLPAGRYQVTCTRGPEYRTLHREIEVPDATEHTERFKLERWIHPATLGWFSSDHHIHAAGCAHYSSPTQGVEPADMFRHIVGEDLNVGCVLTWGPCWYYQKQFFQGQVSALSAPNNLMRYDVEVSGFPSSHCGHLVLLRLKEDEYPGTKRIEDWPSWDLPILKWAKGQGGVAGFAHSGWGLAVPATKLPNDDLPPFDGIGANEYIADVTHGACDFISTMDTPAVWELNIWYHTLNCGFTTRISGETDFPCIYENRVGQGRAYVKLPLGKPLNFDAWANAIRAGRSYTSDGLAHLMGFTANGLGVGEPGDKNRPSVLAVHQGDALKITVKAAAMLEAKPRDDIRNQPLKERPYWHVERARIGDTRTVPVELIVNGEAIERKTIEADGKLNDVSFEFTPQRSSWIAVRILPAAHTNPIFVEVDGQPIRASRRSAEWCLRAVERCRTSKMPQIREAERPAANAAYDHARKVYERIKTESFDEGAL
jgi:hypothetical protein